MFPGMVLEHYSWTKVTTSVSNFLFGSPIIDHFGEMVSPPCHSPRLSFDSIHQRSRSDVLKNSLDRLLRVTDQEPSVISRSSHEDGGEQVRPKSKERSSTRAETNRGPSPENGRLNSSLVDSASILRISLPTLLFPPRQDRRRRRPSTFDCGRIPRSRWDNPSI